MHSWQDLAEFLLGWEMFQTEVVEKIKTHILYSENSTPTPRKSCRLWNNVEKYGRTRQTAYDNVIRRMRFACWITKATDTHSEFVILYYFYAAKMVTRTRLSVTFIHFPSCNLQPQYFRVFSLRIIPPVVLQHLWFDVFLTVHHSIDFSKYQLSAQFF